ncbi:OST5-like protein [Saccharomyces kudriavzevii IFO 1802]|uniref:Dolichyl-diphosphooligosaccharide-protein glycosyltransferase subunit OST5 n=1 Tax=Saccharomyces kudriavzevii (strain ATCC MYA-4449 / AS 2.2408 / CBS 8840 / NBRC 1802 / NCYC 2889) TaxID=226230 RepID=J5PGV5_SACK1|nr:OST5-like protein [Saccharomyces kudriavzevii IFO 1802]
MIYPSSEFALSLKKEFHSTNSFEPFIDLDTQPKFAICGLLVTLVLISSALFIVGSKSSFVKKFFLYTILSVIGSLFAGLTTVFASNSFGVYV